MITKPDRKPASAPMLLGVSDRYSARRMRQLYELLSGLRSQGAQWMRAMREQTSVEDSTLGDEGDNAVSDENRELIASLAQLAGGRAAAVESALERLRDGRYGVCEDCEDEIPLERLQAMPWTVLCVDCQRDRENASRHLPVEQPALWEDERGRGPVAAELEPADVAVDNNSLAQSAPRRRRGRPRREVR